MSIDGVDFDDANAFLRTHSAGDKVVLTLERDDETRTAEVTLTDKSTMIPTLTYRADATEMQSFLRDSWISSIK